MRTTTTSNSTRHYYAFDWAYGYGSYWSEDDGTSYPAGSVHVFDTREARDAWIAAEPYQGHEYHRAAMDASEAVPLMRTAVRSIAQYPEDVAAYSVAQLVAAYNGLEA